MAEEVKGLYESAEARRNFLGDANAHDLAFSSEFTGTER